MYQKSKNLRKSVNLYFLKNKVFKDRAYLIIKFCLSFINL